MIANFRIVKGAVVPYLEVTVTKNGLIPLFGSPIPVGCNGQTATDPNLLDTDLINFANSKFEMYKCGRVPQKVIMQGVLEAIQSTVTEGDITKKINIGQVRYKWHPEDTEEAGLYYGRFVFELTDGSKFIWPFQLESLSIEVTP